MSTANDDAKDKYGRRDASPGESRTRLDEIADKAMIHFPTPPGLRFEDVRAWLLKQLEKGFEHGVRQGVDAAVRNSSAITYYANVRPAPAAEPEKKPGSHHTWAERSGGLKTWCCDKVSGIAMVGDMTSGFYPCGCAKAAEPEKVPEATRLRRFLRRVPLSPWAPTGISVSDDTRKGERRKLHCRVMCGPFFSIEGGWFYVDGADTLRRDRRKKDRRKP